MEFEVEIKGSVGLGIGIFFFEGGCLVTLPFLIIGIRRG